MTMGKRAMTAVSISIPIAVFLILQSQGIGIFSLGTIFDRNIIQTPNALVRTGLLMSQEGANVYVAWVTATDNQDVFVRASNDGGKSFGPINNVSESEGKSVTRALGSKGSALYVVWVDEVEDNHDVYFRRSMDGGRTFENKINLSNSEGNSEFPVIDAEGPTLYVAWIDDTQGNDEVLFRASHDSGATFGEVINLSNNNGNSESPRIIAQGSNVYVVWHDDSDGDFDVLFRASHDAGRTFDPTINLSDNAEDSGFAVLAVGGTNVYAAWIDHTNGRQEIFFRVSKDAGTTFGPIKNLSQSEVKSTFPSIDADGPLVCVTWIDEGMEMTLYASCSMEGSDFRETIQIASGKELKSNIIWVEGMDVYTSWIDASSAVNGVFLRVSNDAGKSFTPPKSIAVGQIDTVRVMAKGTNVYALWSDKKCDDEECRSVTINAYFSRSTNNGITFENPVRLN